jgi:hypothetical protein
MSRKRCHRRPREARTPTLVALAIVPELEIAERLALQAFVEGRADTEAFDTLADVRDMLTLAAGSVEGVGAICELGYVALANIKDRAEETSVLEATDDEIQALQALVDFACDWWRRQAGTVYATAYNRLREERKNQARARAQFSSSIASPITTRNV